MLKNLLKGRRKFILSIVGIILGSLSATGILDGSIGYAIISIALFVGIEGARDVIIALRGPGGPSGGPGFSIAELSQEEREKLITSLAERIVEKVIE